MVAKIASILKNRGSELHCVSPDATAYEAVAAMATHRIAAVLVMDHGGLRGIFSGKDYGSRVVLHGKDGRDVRIREVMTSPIVTVDSNATVSECMQIMTEKNFRHLPVFENGELVGLVTLADLVRHQLADKKFKIEQLMQYIGS